MTFMRNIKSHQKKLIGLSFFHKMFLKLVYKLVPLTFLLFLIDNSKSIQIKHVKKL